VVAFGPALMKKLKRTKPAITIGRCPEPPPSSMIPSAASSQKRKCSPLNLDRSSESPFAYKLSTAAKSPETVLRERGQRRPQVQPEGERAAGGPGQRPGPGALVEATL
jgi:hypothetical protein